MTSATFKYVRVRIQIGIRTGEYPHDMRIRTLNGIRTRHGNTHTPLEYTHMTWEYIHDIGIRTRHENTHTTWEYAYDMGIRTRHENTHTTWNTHTTSEYAHDIRMFTRHGIRTRHGNQLLMDSNCCFASGLGII